MMSDIRNVFDVAGRAMSAQMTRLNTISSNLAYASSVSSTPEGAFRPMRAVFAAEYADKIGDTGLATVDVTDVVALDSDLYFTIKFGLRNRWRIGDFLVPSLRIFPIASSLSLPPGT